MEFTQMVVGVISISHGSGLRILSVRRNPNEGYFDDCRFLPGRISPPGKWKSEPELLADEFSERLGLQFTLKEQGSLFTCHFGGINYHMLPLRGSLNSINFKEKCVKYKSVSWDDLRAISKYKTASIMNTCLEQFGLL